MSLFIYEVFDQIIFISVTAFPLISQFSGNINMFCTFHFLFNLSQANVVICLGKVCALVLVSRFSFFSRHTFTKIRQNSCKHTTTCGFKILSAELLGRMTTNVCRPRCRLCPSDPVWPSDPVPPPTPLGTNAVETEPTPKAPEPTPQIHPQPSVSNMNGVNKKGCIR